MTRATIPSATKPIHANEILMPIRLNLFRLLGQKYPDVRLEDLEVYTLGEMTVWLTFREHRYRARMSFGESPVYDDTAEGRKHGVAACVNWFTIQLYDAVRYGRSHSKTTT